MSPDSVISSPLTVGQIVSRTFGVYRARFGYFVLLVAPTVFVGGSMVGRFDEKLGAFYVCLGLIVLWMGSLASQLVAVSHCEGGAAVGDQKYWLRACVLVSLMQGLVALPCVAGWVIAYLDMTGIIIMGPAIAAVALLLFLLGVPFFIYMTLRWAVAIPAVLADRLLAAAALRRSWVLTRGHLWHTIGLWLAIGTILFTWFVVAFISLSVPFYPGIMEIVTTILYLPVGGIATVVLYYDLRARHEAPVAPSSQLAPEQPVPGLPAGPQP
jgi:hypothetical protein